MRNMLWILGFFAIAMLCGACATAGPPPQATQIPYSPTLITLDRAAYANDWKLDVATREGVQAYVLKLAEKAHCTPDWWINVNAAWSAREDKQWANLLTFQPLPNAPTSTGSFTDLISALTGAAVRVAPLMMGAMPVAAPPPPC